MYFVKGSYTIHVFLLTNENGSYQYILGTHFVTERLQFYQNLISYIYNINISNSINTVNGPFSYLLGSLFV